MALEIEHQHALPEPEAKARLEALGEYFANRHKLKIAWPSPSKATVSGKYAMISIVAEIELAGPGRIKLRGPDPGFLMRKKAEEYLRKKLTTYLNPATPLADLDRG
ncbi:MAG: polyhydroxyalkanoic acid system family protein [Myxococcales bacterium]|nr:polyhydroxyalkanoic acid system family protein [Myxococcales bacterium]